MRCVPAFLVRVPRRLSGEEMPQKFWILSLLLPIGLFVIPNSFATAQALTLQENDADQEETHQPVMGANSIASASVARQWMSESVGRVFGELGASYSSTKLTDFNLVKSVWTIEQIKKVPRPPQRDPEPIFDPMVAPASATMVQRATSGSQTSNLPEEPVAADEQPTSAPAIAGAITEANLLSEIERQKTAIGGDEQMDEMQKSDRLEMLASAHGSLLKATTYRLKRDEYKKQLAEYPQTLQTLEQDLVQQPDIQSLAISPDATADALDSELQRLEREFQEQEKLLIDLETENNELSRRITEIPGIRATTSEELEKVEERLATISDSDEDLDAHLSWLLQHARKISFEAQLEMLDAEIERQKLAGKVLPLKRDQTSRLTKRLKSNIAKHETAIAKLRRKEVQLQAQQARLKAINAHPALKNIATRNQELTQLRSNITSRIQSANEELSQVEALIDSLLKKKLDLESKIELVGVTNANGMLLVESRRSLASPFESQSRIKEIQAGQQTINVATLTLEEERKSLSDPAEFVANELGQVADQVVGGEPLSKMAIKFVQTKRQYLDDLLNDYNQYLGLLSSLTVDRQELIDQISDIRGYIDEKALWVRNADPVSVNDIWDSAVGLKSFFAPERWGEIGAEFTRRIRTKPHESILGACGICVLLIFTRRLKQH